jgi:hypothetical protein
MEGRSAFDHLGLATMKAKKYISLNQFLMELKGVISTSDTYTNIE